MRYKVFISYRRRNGGLEMAKILKKQLQNRYAIAAFLDADNLREGRFDEQLIERIKKCDKVVLVLPPGALEQCGEENDWVRWEIEYARKFHKTIIPVYQAGDLSWRDEENLPESMRGLGYYNGVEYHSLYLDATVKKLAGYLGKRRHFLYHHLFGSSIKRAGLAACMLAAVCMIVWLAGCASRRNHEPLSFDEEFNDHLVMELNNASHQYEQGLYSWKRLDYNRAQRDILAAHDEMSEQIPQYDVEMAKVNNSLGCLYLDMGKYEEAYDFLNSAYITFRKAYGKRSLEARAVQYSIAQHDYYTGDFATALKTCQAILDDTDAAEDKTVVCAVKHLQAKILDERGQWEEALDIYDEVLGLYSGIEKNGELAEKLTDYVYGSELEEGERDYYSNASRWVALTYNAKGSVYLHMGECNKGRRAFDQALTICLENVYIGDNSLITAQTYKNLAVVYGHRREIRRGLDCIDRAVKIPFNLFGFEEDQYPGLVEVYDVYGDLLHLAGEEEQAESYYEKACDLSIASYGENHPQTAAAYNAFGLYYYDIADYETAVTLFEQAIEIRKNILGIDYTSTAIYYANLAKAYEAGGNQEKAQDALEHAKEICDGLEMESGLIDQLLQWAQVVETEEDSGL